MSRQAREALIGMFVGSFIITFVLVIIAIWTTDPRVHDQTQGTAVAFGVLTLILGAGAIVP